MRKIFREKEFKIWAILAILLILIWIVVLLTINNSQNNNEKVFLEEELKRFEGEVNSTITTYQSFSNYIFDEINADEEILSMMYQANIADDIEKGIIRKKLYDKAYDNYLRMKQYDYRQFHFHLANTESFLRVHAPELYGDLLLDVRESVRIVNEEMISVSGFEEGKIFNGFRHVYPLKYGNHHIGSVEISISSASIIETFSKLFSNEDFYFVILKSVVEEKLFEEKLGNYTESYILDDYYVDKEVDKITNLYSTVVPASRELFFGNLKEEQSKNLKDKKSFAALYDFDGKDYTVKFLSLENLEETPVAYLISVSKSVGYEKFNTNMYWRIILVTLLVFFVIFSALIFAFYHNKLKKSSELDHLTKIYNRSKFYELFKRDVKSSKRYKYDSSVMIIDIDFFKKINDAYGHAWGDRVLETLAREISRNIRETDIFARWGGEEFVILLPHTKIEDAIKVAEKLRLLIDESDDDKLAGVTISIGVSQIDSENHDVDNAIKLADDAMYCAKANGRNQVHYK